MQIPFSQTHWSTAVTRESSGTAPEPTLIQVTGTDLERDRRGQANKTVPVSGTCTPVCGCGTGTPAAGSTEFKEWELRTLTHWQPGELSAEYNRACIKSHPIRARQLALTILLHWPDTMKWLHTRPPYSTVFHSQYCNAIAILKVCVQDLRLDCAQQPSFGYFSASWREVISLHTTLTANGRECHACCRHPEQSCSFSDGTLVGDHCGCYTNPTSMQNQIHYHCFWLLVHISDPHTSKSWQTRRWKDISSLQQMHKLPHVALSRLNNQWWL